MKRNGVGFDGNESLEDKNMAKKETTAVPAIIDNVEALEKKMAAMREAQKVFATYTQELQKRILPDLRKNSVIL